MSEQNKALVRQFNDEVWNKGNLAKVDELFANTWVWHWHELPGGIAAGPEGLKHMVRAFYAAFSEMSATVDDQVAEGDKVAWRWTVRANHTGEFMGIPPTNKRITLTGTSVDRIAGGKFVDRWDTLYNLSLLQQLGAIPTLGPTGP